MGYGGYGPLSRLDLSTVAAVAGAGGRPGTRGDAAYDGDATTVAVEASRLARRAAVDTSIRSIWFATVSPPYDVMGSVRGAMGALRAAATQPGGPLAVAGDARMTRSTSTGSPVVQGRRLSVFFGPQRERQ
jgi:hypothetical protein